MSTMAILVKEITSDASGQAIKVGKVYGYTQESNGTFHNTFMLVTGFGESSGYHVYPTVKGLVCTDGSFYNNNNRDRSPGPVTRSTIKNSNKLWPISDEVVATNPCCIKIKEDERSVQISEE